MSAASSLAATVQQVTQGLSIALAASIVAGAGAGETTAPAIGVAFICVGLIGLVSILDFMRLPRNAGADVSGARAKTDSGD
jgi:hypothetical protein